eukprot:361549-Chlamydomonas_euryale.AAC.3
MATPVWDERSDSKAEGAQGGNEGDHKAGAALSDSHLCETPLSFLHLAAVEVGYERVDPV